MSADFSAWSRAQLQAVETALDGFLTTQGCAQLGEAMRYATLGGGKRLRALLVLATASSAQGNMDAALRAACAVEMIHAYSLVHDDMPCMDNDVLRRGKPTVHIAYGQAMALLVGDALQTAAFEVLTPPGDRVPASVQAALVGLLARASGQNGMAGGQAVDLLSVGQVLDEAQLQTMHALKTGALLEASVMMGAACSPLGQEQLGHLRTYAKHMGLAFQVVDDILDCTSDTATLGKTAGKDVQANKPTYVALMGLDGAKAFAARLHADALQGLHNAQLNNADALAQLAHMVVERVH